MSIFDINNDNTLEVTGEYLEGLGFMRGTSLYFFEAYIPVYGPITTKLNITYFTETQQMIALIHNNVEDYKIEPTTVKDTFDVTSFINHAKCIMIQFQIRLYEGHRKEWYCELMDRDDPFRIVTYKYI